MSTRPRRSRPRRRRHAQSSRPSAGTRHTGGKEESAADPASYTPKNDTCLVGRPGPGTRGKPIGYYSCGCVDVDSRLYEKDRPSAALLQHSPKILANHASHDELATGS